MSSSDFEEFDIQIIETHARAPEAPNVNMSSGEKGIPFPSPAPEPKHQRFYFEGGETTFLVSFFSIRPSSKLKAEQVQGTLYRIPHYFLLRDSPYFRELLNKSTKNAASASPIPLEGVDCAEFDAFLSILYPTDFHECELKTVEAWTAVLRLSTEWSFASVRKLAISRLQPIASDVDKVVLGSKYKVDAWACDGRVALCDGPEPLTWEEGLRLGFAEAMLIMTVRERVRARCSSYASDIKKMIEDYFEKEGNAASAKKIDDEVAAGKRAYEEAIQKKAAFEETVAQQAVEEARAKKRAEEEAAEKKKAENEAEADRKANEEAAAKRRAEEVDLQMAEEEARQKEEKKAALKKWEEAYDKKVADEAALKNARAAAAKKAEEDAAWAAKIKADKAAAQPASKPPSYSVANKAQKTRRYA
ncbi:hypothetical protein DENSPDRAFT_928933 [Dentipellis sp. KUC8613]|nr:hypothetical protein DENSPDRAFT_928933 [Dentipellis sp. KUC8613]